LEWDIRHVLKSVLGKIVEVSFNENAPQADVYLKNLLTPLRDYIYRFFECVDSKEVLPRNYRAFNQFMQGIAELFIAVEAFLSGVLERTDLLKLLKKKEKLLLTSDISSLFLGA